jgi:hypothetical protein
VTVVGVRREGVPDLLGRGLLALGLRRRGPAVTGTLELVPEVLACGLLRVRLDGGCGLVWIRSQR